MLASALHPQDRTCKRFGGLLLPIDRMRIPWLPALQLSERWRIRRAVILLLPKGIRMPLLLVLRE
jgi:hypothetical protein